MLEDAICLETRYGVSDVLVFLQFAAEILEESDLRDLLGGDSCVFVWSGVWNEISLAIEADVGDHLIYVFKFGDCLDVKSCVTDVVTEAF